jgi:diguanylate cyclase (GGDEF)-like protein
VPERLESVLVERCPDFLVVLDRELRVLEASASLRSAVPLAAPGQEFATSLDEVSAARLIAALSSDQDGTSRLPLDLIHRGRERLIPTSYRFYPLEHPLIAGVGREGAADAGLVDQVATLNRRYQESLAQLASLTGKLRELATTDALTGLFNRRAFMDRAESEWARHLRYKHPIACVMLDVDHFKQVNDTHGHAAGDAVLQHVGALMRASLRTVDLSARIGGDEFVALMPDTTMEGAFATAERLLMRLLGRPLTGLEREVRVTASLGVATSEECQSLDQLFARADHALYEAKAAGRGCVVKDQ